MTENLVRTPTLSEWIAAETKNDPAKVEFIGFQAEEGYRYSEYTEADMSCNAIYTLDGERKSEWLGEADVVRMLNEVFPTQKEET